MQGLRAGVRRFGLPMIIVVAVPVVAGLAVAQDDGAGTGSNIGPVSAEAMQKYEELCGTGDLCAIVPGAVDPSDPAQPVAERVASHGIPASDCPGAAAEYDRHGPKVDVFLGACPSPSEVSQRLRNLDPAARDARLEKVLNRKARDREGTEGP